MTHIHQRKRAKQLLSLVGVFVAIVFAAYIYRSVTKPIIGPDNCVYEDGQLVRKKISDQTIIVIDQSEELSPSHKRQVKELLVDYISDDRQLPVRSGVMLYVFGKNDFQSSGAGQDLKPIVSLCRPPSSGNEVYENKRKLERTFRDGFILPLYQLIDQSLEIALGERTPILEMLQYISHTQEIKESEGGKHKKTLILISDLLQHSASFSHYNKGGTYDDFLRSASQLRADLRGWTVRLVYLQRYGKDQRLQNKQLLEFWMRYFDEIGGTIEKIEKVP